MELVRSDLAYEDVAVLCEDASEARVRVAERGVKHEALQQYLEEGGRYKQVVGLNATGAHKLCRGQVHLAECGLEHYGSTWRLGGTSR